MISISGIDHLVITVKDIPASIKFYVRVLGMHAVQFCEGSTALHFSQQKINLHEADSEFEPKAKNATPGSADLCLITDTELMRSMMHVQGCQVEIIEGPVERTSANGKLLSFYIRNPDFNLFEISNTL